MMARPRHLEPPAPPPAPDVVVRRLVVYLRVLQELPDGPDVYISSQELGARAGVSPSQVRKDLAAFGEFGKQGVGYSTRFLRGELAAILHADRPVRLGLVGVGDLGMAIARYNVRRHQADAGYQFRLLAAFDVDPRRVGTLVEDAVPVHHVDELPAVTRRLELQAFIVTVPAAAAQEVTDRIVASGVKAILNFAPVKLVVPPGVRLQHSDVALELAQLAYYLPTEASGQSAPGD